LIMKDRRYHPNTGVELLYSGPAGAPGWASVAIFRPADSLSASRLRRRMGL
jgi:hypothetical protein